MSLVVDFENVQSDIQEGLTLGFALQKTGKKEYYLKILNKYGTQKLADIFSSFLGVSNDIILTFLETLNTLTTKTVVMKKHEQFPTVFIQFLSSIKQSVSNEDFKKIEIIFQTNFKQLQTLIIAFSGSSVSPISKAKLILELQSIISKQHEKIFDFWKGELTKFFKQKWENSVLSEQDIFEEWQSFRRLFLQFSNTVSDQTNLLSPLQIQPDNFREFNDLLTGSDKN